VDDGTAFLTCSRFVSLEADTVSNITKSIIGQLFSLSRLRPSYAKEDQSNKFQRLGFNVLQQFTFDPSSSDFLNPRRRLELRIFITQLPSGN